MEVRFKQKRTNFIRICINNSDKKFGDCSKSQEMSNEEINEELGIGQDEADAYDCDAAKRGKEKEPKSKRLTGTCPAGDLCSNQQFQKRKYVKFERFQSGKKGYGLRLLEDVRDGQFLIEYVGEVLDMQSYETRQKEYACKGQKHFYFMTLNGNEPHNISWRKKLSWHSG